MTDKAELRKKLRSRRRALPGFRQHISAQTLARRVLLHYPAIRRVQHIAFYLANDGEISLYPLMNYCMRKGYHCYLPVLDKHGYNRLDFAPWVPGMEMSRNRFAINEPVVPRRLLRQSHQLETIFMPLVGFDDKGNRLGMGGGFYDRTLATVHNEQISLTDNCSKRRPFLIAVAHDTQCTSSVPSEPWDISPNMILTPTRIIRPHATRAIAPGRDNT